MALALILLQPARCEPAPAGRASPTARCCSNGWMRPRRRWARRSAVFVNGQACVDRAYRVRARDEVLVTFTPGWITAVSYILAYMIEGAIVYAVGYLIGKLFGPKRPAAGDTPQPSQVYGIAPPKNAARLGQPIPVIYGSVIALPDFASQPYTPLPVQRRILLRAAVRRPGRARRHRNAARRHLGRRRSRTSSSSGRSSCRTSTARPSARSKARPACSRTWSARPPWATRNSSRSTSAPCSSRHVVLGAGELSTRATPSPRAST